jgi:DNA-binding beta-propeller fold protein YncE
MFNRPAGEAIDSASRVWVTNAEGNSVIALNNAGTLFGYFAPPGANFNIPNAVAIDSSGNVWVTNKGGATITELVGAAAPVKTPIIGPPQLP